MARLRLSASAQADIAQALRWTDRHFGGLAKTRYEHLLATALRHLAADPLRADSVARPELGDSVRSYHVQHSRTGTGVARPRHLILYRVRDDAVLNISRVLHDAMELERHARFDPPLTP